MVAGVCIFINTFLIISFIPPIATTDLDLFLPSVSKLKDSNISKVLTDLDYHRDDDCLSGKTTFLSKEGFTIELLTLPDRNMKNVIIIKGSNIGVEALAKMAPAGWNYLKVDFNGMLINVTSPVSFVLQKLLINKERKSEYKKLKDLDAIKYVLSFIKMSKKYNDELIESLNTYPKKWKKTILDTAKENNIELI